MNDEKIEHLRKLALIKQRQVRLRNDNANKLLLRLSGSPLSPSGDKDNKSGNNGGNSDKTNFTNNSDNSKDNASPKQTYSNNKITDHVGQNQQMPSTTAQSKGIVKIMKNHSGIPFVISLMQNFRTNVNQLYTRSSTLNQISLSYAKYEIIEENVINLLEVASFIMNYFVPTNNSGKGKRRIWSKLMNFIDKVILVLRFKILIAKVFKLYKLQKFYKLQKQHKLDSTITIENKDVVADALLRIAEGDGANTNGTANANGVGENGNGSQLVELTGKDSELQSFEAIWNKTSSSSGKKVGGNKDDYDEASKGDGSSDADGQASKVETESDNDGTIASGMANGNVAIIKQPALDHTETSQNKQQIIQLSQLNETHSKENNGDNSEDNEDITALLEFKSTEDEIHGLRTEIVVEFIDFCLLLYPKSITELVYEKLFARKK